VRSIGNGKPAGFLIADAMTVTPGSVMQFCRGQAIETNEKQVNEDYLHRQ
jgi:hypothetical protein